MTTVEAEKAEAMRRYNNRKSFPNILRAAAIASLCCLWFPTVLVSLQAVGTFFITDRAVVFLFANILIALIFVLSCHNNNESSGSDSESDLYDQYISSSNNNQSCSCNTELDLYHQYTSSSVEEKVEDDDDSKKQIVPDFMAEIEEEANPKAVTKRIYRRTKSEMKREIIIRPVMEMRRTERLTNEEFQLKMETSMMDLKKRTSIMDMMMKKSLMKKRSLMKENDIVQYLNEPGLLGGAASSFGYGSC